VPVCTNVFLEEICIFGVVTAREGNETTIEWDEGAKSIVADEDDDLSLFTVIESGIRYAEG
jgi:hypothetical protein